MSFLYFLKRIVFVKRHVWFFRIYIIQPLIYDKTSDVAVPHKVTLALAFVMAMNYVAILLCPFIVDAFQNLFHSHSQTFAFWLNLMVALMGMFIVMKQEKLSL